VFSAGIGTNGEVARVIAFKKNATEVGGSPLRLAVTYSGECPQCQRHVPMSAQGEAT